MKNYLLILTAGLLLNVQAHAMAAKNAEAARSSAMSNETLAPTDPTEQDASAEQHTSPIPPLATDEETEDNLDRVTGKRGAIERRMTDKDIPSTRKTSSVSGTITPRY